MKYNLVEDGDERIFLDVSRMENIALRRAADCLSWQNQKSRFLNARRELTAGHAEEIHSFRQEAYDYLRRIGLKENEVGRYMK